MWNITVLLGTCRHCFVLLLHCLLYLIVPQISRCTCLISVCRSNMVCWNSTALETIAANSFYVCTFSIFHFSNINNFNVQNLCVTMSAKLYVHHCPGESLRPSKLRRSDFPAHYQTYGTFCTCIISQQQIVHNCTQVSEYQLKI